MKSDRFSVWDATSGKRISPYYSSENIGGLGARPDTVAISDSGRWLAFTRNTGHLFIYETATQT